MSKTIAGLTFSTSTPQESVEHSIKFLLQQVQETIKKGEQLPRSVVEHNIGVIVHAMERANLIKDTTKDSYFN